MTGRLDSRPRPFIEHLEELRRRVLLSAGAALLGSAGAFFFHRPLFSLLRYPLEGSLVFIAPQEAFIVSLKVSLLAGILIASPIITYHIWSFIGSALSRKEKKFVFFFAPAAFMLFASGSSFGFFIVLPAGLRFLMGFGGPFLEPMLTVDRYVSFVFLMVIVFGITFQLPLVMRILSSSGLAGRKEMAAARPYAVVVIFTVSALLTPPDLFTQIALAVPVILLYEAGLLFAGKKRGDDLPSAGR